VPAHIARAAVVAWRATLVVLAAESLPEIAAPPV